MGILLRQASQMYFGEPERTYIFVPQPQYASPEKRCTVWRIGRSLARLSSTIRAQVSQSSSEIRGSTSCNTQSLSGFSSHAFPRLAERV
ncbi:MAG: hypothetical protein JWP35_471 [Caulobacter sp.]|nr:hypothetical protein [Caulobacter sp.]